MYVTELNVLLLTMTSLGHILPALAASKDTFVLEVAAG